MTRLGLLLALLVGCSDPDVAEVRLEIQASAPNDLLLGEIAGYGGTPGRHYDLWGHLGDGQMVRIVRFAIVPTTEEEAFYHQTNAGTPQLRDWDTGDFIGYVDTSCSLGPCGGSRIITPNDLSTVVEALVTREDDGADDAQPSSDELLRGPIQPYSRGTLRGTLVDPGGAQVPRCDMLVIPVVDGAEL